MNRYLISLITIEYIVFFCMIIFGVFLNSTGQIHPYAFILGYLIATFFLVLLVLGMFLLFGKIKLGFSLNKQKKYLILLPILLFVVYTTISVLVTKF